MSLRWESVCVDATDPVSLASWWAELLGWRVVEEEGDVVAIGPHEGVELYFVRVPEPKAVKDRVHLDLRPDDQAAEVDRALAMGARRVDVGQTGEETWVVLADPEGNEFCILRETAAVRAEERA